MIFRRKQRMAQEFREAIDEAEAHANTATQGESESAPAFKKGYVMGLCTGAALAGMPDEVWASPERHQRQGQR